MARRFVTECDLTPVFSFSDQLRRIDLPVGVNYGAEPKKVIELLESLARVHPHDPSWQAWPALEHAVMNDIVPDFPLINKSFNLSYTGQDL